MMNTILLFLTVLCTSTFFGIQNNYAQTFHGKENRATFDQHNPSEKSLSDDYYYAGNGLYRYGALNVVIFHNKNDMENLFSSPDVISGKVSGWDIPGNFQIISATPQTAISRISRFSSETLEDLPWEKDAIIRINNHSAADLPQSHITLGTEITHGKLAVPYSTDVTSLRNDFLILRGNAMNPQVGQAFTRILNNTENISPMILYMDTVARSPEESAQSDLYSQTHHADSTYEEVIHHGDDGTRDRNPSLPENTVPGEDKGEDKKDSDEMLLPAKIVVKNTENPAISPLGVVSEKQDEIQDTVSDSPYAENDEGKDDSGPIQFMEDSDDNIDVIFNSINSSDMGE